MGRTFFLVVGVIVAASTLTACSSSSGSGGSGRGGAEVVVGALTSLSGANSVSGKPWLAGFHAGLDYVTKGTGEVGGVKITVRDVDDASDPNRALTEATNLVSDNVHILTGTQSSAIGIALARFAAENNALYVVGSANSDALTGVNPNTFRSSRQAATDVATIVEVLGDKLDGANVVLLAHDIEYGKSLISQFRGVVGNRPASITEVLAPFPTPDVAPYVQRVVDAKPDILIPFWSGDTTPLYQALAQQNVIAKTPNVITNTGLRSTWPVLQQVAAPNLQVFTPYPPGALDNEAAKYLEAHVQDVDYTTADGFNAAMMIAHAIQSTDGKADVAAWIKALEGYRWDGPRGASTIRPEDHAMIAPMYLVDYGSGSPKVIRTIAGEDIDLPVAKKLAR